MKHLAEVVARLQKTDDRSITADDMGVLSKATNELRTEILFVEGILDEDFDRVGREFFLEALCHLEQASIAFRKAGHFQYHRSVKDLGY